MGQYFQILNLSKRQYFSASIFNEGVKQSSILQGVHAYALGKLLTYNVESLDKNIKWRAGNEYNLWIGAWAGDKIVIAGDYGHTHLFGLKPINLENPPVSIYHLAELEFENVSGKLICWLVNEEDFSEWLLKELQTDIEYIGKIGYIVYKFPHLSVELRKFIEEHFSKSWEKKCKVIWEDKSKTFIEPEV